MFLQKAGGKIALGILLLSYFIIRCNYLDTVPRWDAASYWGALMQAVNSTLHLPGISALPRTILDTYNAFGHPSMGYYSILVLGQLTDFPNLFMLNMTNILLAMLSIFSVYKIFRWFLPQKAYHTEVLIATAAYAFEPLFFGCSIYLNTDFPVLVFFTTSIACLLYGKYFWLCISSLFMIFSKEPGIMFWAFLMGGAGLYSLWILVNNWKKGRTFILGDLLPPYKKTDKAPNIYVSLIKLLSLFIPGVAFLAFTIAQKGAMWVGGTGLKWDSNGMNCFGLNPRLFANRAGEIFVLNFHWIPTLIILYALFVGLGRYFERKENSINNLPDDSTPLASTILSNERIWGILPIITTFIIFVAFNLTYITYIIPRYVIQGGFFLLIFTLLSLPFAVHSQKIRVGILSFIFVLFFAQTFRTIDPLSKLAFGTAPFGEHEILQIDSPGEAVGNGFVYNSEFTAVDKLFNLMQKAMPMTPETIIIAWNADAWYPWFSMGGVFVDPETLDRTVDWRNTFAYNVINIPDVHHGNAPANAYYVYMPWLSVFSNEQAELAQLRAIYNISEPTEVGFQGYNLRFYKLVKIQ